MFISFNNSYKFLLIYVIIWAVVLAPPGLATAACGKARARARRRFREV